MLAVFAGSVGFPVLKSRDKDLSQPFPCQDSPCGCGSAEQCWRHCCCHTDQEKVAWAHQHGITPPDYVIAAAEKEKASASAGKSCCNHCKHCASSDRPTVAKRDESTKGRRVQHRGPSPNKFEFAVINSDLARRCHGLPGFLTVLTCLAVPEPPLAWSVDEVICGCVYDLPCLPHSAERTPPVPPPKLARNFA